MENRQIVCVLCPKGCVISVAGSEAERTGDISKELLSGYRCKHGIEYVRSELMEPRRVLTTTVRLKGSSRMLPVRSTGPLPKERLLDAMRVLNSLEVHPPVSCGDVVMSNILNLEVDFIATWTVD